MKFQSSEMAKAANPGKGAAFFINGTNNTGNDQHA
jgi:hypothetical protein